MNQNLYLPEEASKRVELFKIHRSMQEKYVYYIIALSIAAIGYVVNLTIKSPILDLKIVGLASLFWLASASIGLYVIDSILKLTMKNYEALKQFHLSDELAGRGYTYYMQLTVEASKKIDRWVLRMNLMFAAGIACFLIWRICTPICI